jgi:RNA polymerase sigma factor (sigma-70 family)
VVAVPSIGRATEVTPRRAAPEADATRDLYERYARQIYSYCLHQLGNREEAEDATQSTFLNAFRGFKRGVDPEFESAWLYKIAQNVCLTRQRSSSRRRKVETPGDLEAMQDYVPAPQSDSDELIRLPEALDAMPEQQRRALLLREWQGLSYKEIADELDLSQAAVETLLFRARRSLAAGLNEEPAKKGASVAKRLSGAGDLGSILSIVKSLVLTGGVKVATAVATVAATSVVAATPVTRHVVEDVVAPRHDKAPAQHVAGTKAAASTGAAAPVSAPFSLVPSQSVPTVRATRSSPLTRAASKTRGHRRAAHLQFPTSAASLAFGRDPSAREPSGEIAAVPTVVVDTAAPTQATAVEAPAPVDTQAPQPTSAQATPAEPTAAQPATTQPVSPTPDKPKPDSSGKGDNQAPASPTPKKDDSNTARSTSSGSTPSFSPKVQSKSSGGAAPAAVTQPMPADGSAAAGQSSTKGSDRSGTGKADDKQDGYRKGNDRRNDDARNDKNNDAKSTVVPVKQSMISAPAASAPKPLPATSAPKPSPVTAVPKTTTTAIASSTLPRPPAPTPTTTTITPSTVMPAQPAPTKQATTTTTTAATPPPPPPPTPAVTSPAPQQPQGDRGDKNDRPAEGHRSDGKGDNGHRK